ncbi:hypothetical protein [Streptomyces phytophilus]|uniref:hypothetical protein n=1 Tax=Streptomyces phytophilus TaxID=722715 RepID=UPI0015F0A5B6|nr:hypothetical protein [Streptomyces phytophilus]
MALTTGDLPFTAVRAVGVDPENRITVEYTILGGSGVPGGVTNQVIADAIRQAMLASPEVASVSATHHGVVETEI